MEPTRKASAGPIPALDGVRGIAVLLVLAFHFSWTFPTAHPAGAILKSVFFKGWTGVDLFFVLSGFLITRGLLADESGEKRLRRFYVKRSLRIFPLYWAFLAVGSVAALAAHGRPASLPFWLYVHNYVQAGDTHVVTWTGHLWSLAIEEQFYLVWPFLVFATRGRTRVALVLALLVGVVVLRFVLVYRYGLTDFALYRLTPTHADGLLLGALSALFEQAPESVGARIWKKARLPALFWTIPGFVIPSLYDMTRIAMVTETLAVAHLTVCVVAAASDGSLSASTLRFLEGKRLGAIGRVSYGMYIIHWPLMVLAIPSLESLEQRLPPLPGVALGLGVIAAGTLVTYGLAEASYRFFESPFLRMKKRLAP